MEQALALVGRPLTWQEGGNGKRGPMIADPAAWGDVVLSRSDAPSSYHLSVPLDDALQGTTHVMRGFDLYPAPSVHRLLQELLPLPHPASPPPPPVPGPAARNPPPTKHTPAI